LVYVVRHAIGAQDTTRVAVSRQSVCSITPPSAFLLDERVFVSLGIL